jgi:glyoxylate reductase
MKVLFTNCSFSENEIKNLSEKGIEIIPAKENLNQEELIQALQGMDGYIIGGTDRAPKEVIEATDLKVIIFYGAGYQDYIDIPSANAKNIVVANTPKANSYTVAEHTVAMILDGVKNITWLNNTTKEGNWFRRRTWNLQDKTLGIIGMGTIGSHVATIMKNGFNMNIIYTSRTPKSEMDETLNAKKVDLETLLKQSDVISIHASLNEETTNMIDTKELSLLKKSAILVNMARPKIVNGLALKETLEKDQIAKAMFDGYYEEPAPTKENDNIGLLSLPDDKFVITPHTAYNTKEAFDNMNNMVIENIMAFEKGDIVPYQVN